MFVITWNKIIQQSGSIKCIYIVFDGRTSPHNIAEQKTHIHSWSESNWSAVTCTSSSIISALCLEQKSLEGKFLLLLRSHHVKWEQFWQANLHILCPLSLQIRQSSISVLMILLLEINKRLVLENIPICPAEIPSISFKIDYNELFGPDIGYLAQTKLLLSQLPEKWNMSSCT